MVGAFAATGKRPGGDAILNYDSICRSCGLDTDPDTDTDPVPVPGLGRAGEFRSIH